jgi:hypothetical protein
MLQDNNTYLTELEVGDKVVEQYQYNPNLRYVSTVTAIDEKFITVKRSDNTTVRYFTKSGSIAYPYGELQDFFLMQYVDLGAPTPMNPGPVSSDAEDLLS